VTDQRSPHRDDEPADGAGRPRVGLVGYYGWGNFGDELFLSAFREHLSDAFDLRVLHDLTARPYFSGAVEAAVEQVDAIIIGGGDLVIPWQMSQLYWKSEYLARPVYVCGVGVPTREVGGEHPRVVEELRAFFQHPSVQSISARDEESAVWIERTLLPRSPVHRTADLVCALSIPQVSRRSDALGIVTRHRRGVQDDVSQVRALARHAQELGLAVRHLVLGTGETRQRDLEIAAALDLPGKELVHSDDLEDLCRAIGECRVLASAKFHGSVVASMYGVPSIVLMPTAKNVRYFTRLGRPELLRHFADRDLASALDPVPAPVAPAMIERLRAEATEALLQLRDDVLQRVAKDG